MKRIILSMLLPVLITGCGTVRETSTITDDAALDRVEEQLSAMIAPQPSRIIAAPVKLEPPAGSVQGRTPEPQLPPAVADPVETGGEIANEEPAEERFDFGESVLLYREWLFFVAYCLVALLGAWYFRRTGQKSETLEKIGDTVNARLGFKHKALFRILRIIYRKKKRKQDK